MKMKKIMAMALAGVTVASLTMSGCGKKDSGLSANGTVIEFQYYATTYNDDAYAELIETYNSTQGKEDKVAVKGIKKTTDYSENINTTLTAKNAPNVISISDKFFKKYADQDRFIALENYMEGYDTSDFNQDLLNRFRYDNSSEPAKAGEGQTLYGLPVGNNPTLIFYNVDLFEAQGVNIISVAEEDLEAYNKEKGTNFKAHGYAEYLTAPEGSLKASKTLDGKTVYKVFNNQIPMNWDELVYLSKYFTKTHNSAATSEYGYLTEWWFSFGWSVGGDCVGWNESKGEYEFTLGDKNPNYLVTKDMTVNGTEYKAGDILTYGDKTALAGADKDGLYKLPSQFDAFARYNSLTQTTNYKVADGVMGVDVGYRSLGDKIKPFSSGTIAMLDNSCSSGQQIMAASKANWDYAPLQQYRCYEGDLDNDGVVKVIGENGYTGDLLKVNGTEIVGKLGGSSLTYGLHIPKMSSEDKYEAAAKFIKWVAGEEGQKILMKGNYVPNQNALLDSDEFKEVLGGKNTVAVAMMAKNACLGDWSYFDNGTWITNWSIPLNDDVRNGKMSLDEFFAENQSVGDKDLAEKNIRMYGRLADE